MLSVVELAQQMGSHLPGGFQGGPLLDKGAGQGTGEVFPDQFQGLREVAFEGAAEPVAQAHLVGDKLAAGLDQQLKLTGDRVIGVPGFEPVPMVEQDVQHEVGVQRVVFGAAGIEGLAEFGAGLGVNRIELQTFIGQERIEQRPPALFQNDGDFGPGQSAGRAGRPSRRAPRGCVPA